MCTRLGQRIDDAALEGRSTLTAEQVQDADELLQTVAIASVVLLGGAVRVRGAAAWRAPAGRRHGRVVIGAANVTTQAMKELLPRSDLVPGRPELVIGQSMPSGHTTVAASIVVAAMLVAPAATGAAWSPLVGAAVCRRRRRRHPDCRLAPAQRRSGRVRGDGRMGRDRRLVRRCRASVVVTAPGAVGITAGDAVARRRSGPRSAQRCSSGW